MDRKQMCVANVQYKKPSADGTKQAKSLLKYLTYRESREEKRGMWRVGSAGSITAWVAPWRKLPSSVKPCTAIMSYCSASS